MKIGSVIFAVQFDYKGHTSRFSTGKKAQLFGILEKACGQIEVKCVCVEGEMVVMMTLEICEWSLYSP